MKKNTQKTATRALRSNALPVSVRFHAEILRRVREATAVISLADESTVGAAVKPLADDAVSAIESYITDRTMPAPDAPAALRLIVCLLRPEIDKAIARSAAARLRAMRRHRSQTPAILPEPQSTQPHPEPTPHQPEQKTEPPTPQPDPCANPTAKPSATHPDRKIHGIKFTAKKRRKNRPTRIRFK